MDNEYKSFICKTSKDDDLLWIKELIHELLKENKLQLNEAIKLRNSLAR